MRKDFVVLGFIGLIIAFLISGTKIQSVEEYYLTHVDDITPDAETVTLTILNDRAYAERDKINPEIHPYLTADGVVLGKTTYVLRDGDTVFDVLNRATRHERIQMEYQGADLNIYNSIYIQGINYLYEFACGSLSGWMYSVNGEFPTKGVSQYAVKNGDDIIFRYTCNLGKDIGHDEFE